MKRTVAKAKSFLNMKSLMKILGSESLVEGYLEAEAETVLKLFKEPKTEAASGGTARRAKKRSKTA